MHKAAVRCPDKVILLKSGYFKPVISVLGMFLSPENDSSLRDKHCKLGLCPGLLNRLYEQHLPMRRLLLLFLKASQGSACTLAHRTPQWDRSVCSPKERLGTVAQVRCLLQLCPPIPYNVHGFGHHMVLHRSTVGPSPLASHQMTGRWR